MSVTATVLSIVLTVVFTFTGSGKLVSLKAMRETGERIGVPKRLDYLIGTLEIAAAMGLLVGFHWHALGAAAAGGLVVLMLAAFGWHARAKEPAQGLPALVLAVLAAALFAARI